MTKLMEWLTVIGLFAIMWLHALMNKMDSDFLRTNHTLILFLPLILVITFGLYAASVVMYRVFTFNNCEDAAADLQKDIEDAKKDLTRLGFVFVEPKKDL